MSRFRISLLALLVGAVALGAACGGGSSSSSGASTLEKGDVAVVGSYHITRAQLDHQIQLQETSAKISNQKLPTAGSSAFKTQVTDAVLGRLVSEAQVENIAKQLGVTVTDAQVQAALNKGIQAQFGGDQAKYQAFLKKYGITAADLESQVIRPSLLQQKITAKLKAQYAVTDAQMQDYYNKNKASFLQPDTRKVHYVLAKDKADADKARALLAGGSSFASVDKKYSLDYNASTPTSQVGALTATKGQLEANFENAVFNQLQTGGLSVPVPVSQSYASSNLAGKCKPTCYFIIRADADTVKGSQQTFDQVKSQIQTTLEQSVQQQKISARVQALFAAQKKITHYAPGYEPAAPTSPPSTSGGPAT